MVFKPINFVEIAGLLKSFAWWIKVFHNRIMWKRSTLLFILITALTIALGIVADRVVPEQHLPWRSLNPEAPLGVATKTQFMRLALSPSKTCMDMAQAATNLNSVPSEPHKPNKTCGWKIARTVSGSSAANLSPIDVDMQCPLAIGAYIWLSLIHISEPTRPY